MTIFHFEFFIYFSGYKNKVFGKGKLEDSNHLKNDLNNLIANQLPAVAMQF